MDTSGPRRLAALPGYDTAPDIYETPDLTDDTSTTAQTASPSDVETSATSEDDEHDDNDEIDTGYGVSRRRLYPSRARERFGEASRRVDVQGVDLSDRVDGKRRGYRVRHRGDERMEEESFDARIARLRREIEECKGQAEERKKAHDEENGDDHDSDQVEDLSQLLKSFEAPIQKRPKAREIAAEKGASPNETGHDEHHDEDISAEQVLPKVADFDSRLASLERALGISSLDAPATMANAPSTLSTPLLPSLALLDQQLTALTSASSTAHLEAASRRIDKLRRDAADLAQTAGHPTPPPPNSRPSSSGSQNMPTTLSPADLDKLQALYTLLPTLQTLTPTVPAMLDRLRSLRALHGSAAQAAGVLDGIEKRQVEMQEELKEWRAGLEKVESAVAEAEEGNGKNGKAVEAWVKELEGRMSNLR